MPWNTPSHPGIFTQQPYETKALEIALKQSSIICFNRKLFTEFVAHKLISEFTEDGDQSLETFTVLFVETENEVKQQVHKIDSQLNISVIGLDFETFSLENKNCFFQQLYNHKVLVMCPDLMIDLLSIDNNLILKIKMLIFQNCQLIKDDDHPYRAIMQKIDELETRPAIYGLTSSLLDTDISAEDLSALIHLMEDKYHCKAFTTTDLVSNNIHSMAKTEEQIILGKEFILNKLYKKINEILQEAISYLKDCQLEKATASTELRDWELVNIESSELNLNVKDKVKVDENNINVTGTPLDLLKGVVEVLNVLGVWSAYKLTLTMLKLVHKSLTPSYRHFKPDEKVFSTGIFYWSTMLLCYLYGRLHLIYRTCYKELGSYKYSPDGYLSPKVQRLLEILKEYQIPSNQLNENESTSWEDSLTELSTDNEEVKPDPTNISTVTSNNLCAVVFVHNNYVAVMLQLLLRERCKEDKELKHVNSSHLVITNKIKGPKSRDSLDATAMDKSKQEEVLRKFRNREINVLITSDCLEECSFATRCNLVISFDIPTTYRDYVDSKGKCRASSSAYVIIADENKKKIILDRLREYKKIEEVLGSPVPCRDQFHKDSDENSSSDEFEDSPSYSTPKQTARMKNAIKVVNKYCCRLPGDGFTHVGPKCEVITNEKEGFYCILQLPINSHVRHPIKGVVMDTVVKAQQVVAVEACKQLHLAGELDDDLNPIGKETIKYAEELELWSPEPPTSINGRPGSTKRRQTYTKASALCLSDCLPRPDQVSYIYEIEMKTRVPLPEKLNVRMRRLHLPEETSRCFGIVTSKQIPHIPRFPIFTRSGEEIAGLRLVRSFVSFSSHHLHLIRNFHKYIFSEVLRLERTNLSFQPESSLSQFFVVVLNKEEGDEVLDIDWEFMTSTDSKRRYADKMKRDLQYNYNQTNLRKNKIYKFERSLYEDGVVIAKYRNGDQPNRFYVAEIKDTMTPMSPFPSDEYSNFHEYYKIKYKLEIRQKGQPLIDVDHTSTRLNLLTPRYVNQKGRGLQLSSLDKKRAKYENLHNHQILIPELCEVHPVPASLWRKAVCLPSIIYKMGQLLISEELRIEISESSGITAKQIPFGFQWMDICYCWADSAKEIFEPLPLLPSKIDEVDEDQEMKIGGDEDQEMKIGGDEDQEIKIKEDEDQEMKIKEDQDQEMKIEEDQDQEMNIEEDEDQEMKIKEDEDQEMMKVEDESLLKKNQATSEEKSSEEDEEDETHQDPSIDSTDEDESPEDEEYMKIFTLSCEEEETENNKKKKKKKRKRRKRKTISDYVSYTIPIEIFDQLKDIHGETGSKSLIGPGPETILQALTLSSASEGVNLERLEMLGDSFLKHAVTVYLYCTYPEAHEGKLSYMRSKKVSNHNLYRIGKSFGLANRMSSLIFDPTANWLPTGYMVGRNEDLFDSDCDIEIDTWKSPEDVVKKLKQTKKLAKKKELNETRRMDSSDEDVIENFNQPDVDMIDSMLANIITPDYHNGKKTPFDINKYTRVTKHFYDHKLMPVERRNKKIEDVEIGEWTPTDTEGRPINYNEPLTIDLHTQQSLADKSIADSVEGLLGSYLTTCGHRAAQLLLCYFGVKVLPKLENAESNWRTVDKYGYLKPPEHGINHTEIANNKKLKTMLRYISGFERRIGYTFKNKFYLLQAFTHASYTYNIWTDCYQRLEFLGDAVLDYLITSYLFKDKRQHSPGALTDLRSALVNNTIFASLAVRNDFHKYFLSLSPELQRIIEEFVNYQQMKDETQGMDAELMRTYTSGRTSTIDSSVTYMNHSYNESQYTEREFEDEDDEVEDIEVPKALGDIFESVAGAIFMDSGEKLEAVWNVYSKMMLPLIEKFSTCVPRSPVRELFELEPETAKFSAGEKRCDGKVRVTVDIIGKGSFKGVGRCYRIAKSAAARRALRFLQRTAQ